jgi:hypothetical protein
VTAQAVVLDPCSQWTSGMVLLGESEAKPSGTRREHEPNGCGESRYETKRGNHLMSIINSCRMSRKVNRQRPRTVKELLERI